MMKKRKDLQLLQRKALLDVQKLFCWNYRVIFKLNMFLGIYICKFFVCVRNFTLSQVGWQEIESFIRPINYGSYTTYIRIVIQGLSLLINIKYTTVRVNKSFVLFFKILARILYTLAQIKLFILL